MEKINIVGIFPSSKSPEGAELALLNPTGEFVEGFYKFKDVRFNDGTSNRVLYHKSSLPCWHPSNLKNIPDFLITNEFLKVEDQLTFK